MYASELEYLNNTRRENRKKALALMERLETAYESGWTGPLKDCEEWLELKNILSTGAM